MNLLNSEIPECWLASKYTQYGEDLGIFTLIDQMKLLVRPGDSFGSGVEPFDEVIINGPIGGSKGNQLWHNHTTVSENDWVGTGKVTLPVNAVFTLKSQIVTTDGNGKENSPYTLAIGNVKKEY